MISKALGSIFNLSITTGALPDKMKSPCVIRLKITAGHRTMSGQIRNLTGQVFYSPVMLTSHIQQSHRNKRKFLCSSVVCDELK